MQGLYRDILVPTVLLGVAFLVGWQAITVAFMVAGYGHFILGYTYRVRARRENVWYLILVPVIVIGLCVLYFYFGGAIIPMLILAPLIFAGHFAIDEFFLHGEALSGIRWASVWLFLGIDFLLSYGLVVPEYRPLAFMGALALLVMIALVVFLRKHKTNTERYLVFIAALLCLISILGSIELVIGVVVLLHCYNWYVHGYERAREKNTAPTYWRDVACTLSVPILLLVASVVYPPLAPLFAVNQYYLYYYPVALAHIATSVRFG